MTDEKKPLFGDDTPPAPPPKTGSTSKVDDLAAVKAKARRKKPRKPGSGRPKGSMGKTKPEEAEVREGEAPGLEYYKQLFEQEASTAALMEWLFDTLSARMGPWWKLKKEESTAGAKLINALLVKHSPLFLKYAEELAMGIWLVSTIGPRYMRTQKELERIAAAQAETDTRPAAEVMAEEEAARSEKGVK